MRMLKQFAQDQMSILFKFKCASVYERSCVLLLVGREEMNPFEKSTFYYRTLIRRIIGKVPYRQSQKSLYLERDHFENTGLPKLKLNIKRSKRG